MQAKDLIELDTSTPITIVSINDIPAYQNEDARKISAFVRAYRVALKNKLSAPMRIFFALEAAGDQEIISGYPRDTLPDLETIL